MVVPGSGLKVPLTWVLFDVLDRCSRFLRIDSSKPSAVARLSSPFWVGAVGVAAIVIGLFMIAGALVGIFQFAA
ncbi:hypothetical protein JNB63_03095 [Microbacterium trichothecenolyticum]|uniref:hypothetical protein n=1 Tax=Microbacterium trichothecenolyticum TaxID=69370 RepID=UPI001C6DE301|nr:hypothetical protein [Microbacterium trichothecenolyticum]MBW9119070.1 hypothetical protein [Microbacterium trichothecenolyticum]